MQVILGSNGIIGEYLNTFLSERSKETIRLVSRSPKKYHTDNEVYAADLLLEEECAAAIKGASIAYLTVGIPFSSERWLHDWVLLIQNCIKACQKYNCKLVYFDNTYLYSPFESVQTESSRYLPNGPKGEGKKKASVLLWDAIEKEQIEAMIVRAPEFYGPGQTKSITTSFLFDRIKAGKPARIPISASSKRSLIHVKDAAFATGLLAMTPDCYQQIWHLPCPEPKSYKEWIALLEDRLARKIPAEIWSADTFAALAKERQGYAELLELLPRYEQDNLYNSDKFKSRFPDFECTSIETGIADIVGAWSRV